MGAVMQPEVQVLLGYELTGSFSRNPLDPRGGAAAFGTPPATTVEEIERFLSQCEGLPGIAQSRRMLQHVADNAWSPAEAVAAALMTLPFEYLGYGMGGSFSTRGRWRQTSLHAPERGHLACQTFSFPRPALASITTASATLAWMVWPRQPCPTRWRQGMPGRLKPSGRRRARCARRS